jgi:hypothetical protein
MTDKAKFWARVVVVIAMIAVGLLLIYISAEPVISERASDLIFRLE